MTFLHIGIETASISWHTILTICLQEHLDYDVVRSSNPEFKKATVRINIYKQHRQTIQVSTV